MNDTRVGYLQWAVVTDGFPLYQGRLGRAIGVRCPRCCQHEIVYNGNYFCADLANHDSGLDNDGCRWALAEHFPNPVLDPDTNRWYSEHPSAWNLVDLIVTIGCAGGRRGAAW